jgi:hypothetical protein
VYQTPKEIIQGIKIRAISEEADRQGCNIPDQIHISVNLDLIKVNRNRVVQGVAEALDDLLERRPDFERYWPDGRVTESQRAEASRLVPGRM